MALIVMLIIGGVIGWLAAQLMGRNEGMLASVVIGVVGAFLGGLLSSLTTGQGQPFLTLTVSSVVWAFVGSVVLVALMNAFQHRSGHRPVV
jgi:uncharacterized membrane protein YeaQ/YmgE (transglycosylase-associated protein family)